MNAEPQAVEISPGLERFGRYEIVHKLASGGMGEVFLARSVGAAGFQKHVVIKKLLPHLTEQAQFVEGLIREAKLLVRLDHPNIVQVLDLGVEGTDYFMAMEYVHGYNLATIIHYCAQNQIVVPTAACAALSIQVLNGLGYAHALTGPDGVTQNIVHRDVSPQNVLISTEGRVKLTDFGIAKIVNESEGEFTQSLKGKFRYMAPEVVEGGRIDHRYDLFAVGILLFESLCRRHLFSGSNDLNILSQVRKAHVPPIARYHPDAPRDLVLVTEKALAKDPSRRYQTAAEFADAIRGALVPSTEADGLAQLRTFVTDIYGRGDFPLNKPKLPDLNAGYASVTRSLMLKSRLAAQAKGGAAARRGWVAWTAVVAAILALAGVGIAIYLATRPAIGTGTSHRDGGPPVIVVKENQKDAAPPARPRDLAAVAVDDKPDARRKIPRKVEPVQKRSDRKFTDKDGQEAFRRDAVARAIACFTKHAGGQAVKLDVITTILFSGTIKRVRVEPAELASTPLGKCVAAAARKVKYIPHRDDQVDFRQPLRTQTN